MNNTTLPKKKTTNNLEDIVVQHEHEEKEIQWGGFFMTKGCKEVFSPKHKCKFVFFNSCWMSNMEELQTKEENQVEGKRDRGGMGQDRRNARL